jgi:putative MATE family efflux protein
LNQISDPLGIPLDSYIKIDALDFSAMLIPWSRVRTIFGLSLPLMLFLLTQTLMGLIGIAMVSHLGDAAVAAIGIATALLSMLMAVLFGIDSAVQALVAQRFGAGLVQLAGATLNDALAIAAVGGLVLALLGHVAGPALFSLVTSDAAVVARGLPYFDAALPMLLFLGANFAFSAYRNGAGTPRHTLLVAAIQLACSALFGYLLIFGALGLPRLEMTGAGLGGTLAAVVALIVHLVLALRTAPITGFLRTLPNRRGVCLVLRIGLPVGLQQSMLYVGTTVFFAIVGQIGTGEVAAMNVVLSMMLLSILAAAGAGMAAATLVGMALGRGDAADATCWGWQVAWLGALGILAFSLVVVVAPGAALGLFIADRSTIELAAAPLGVMALGMSVDAFGRILGFALRGAGATRLVTAVAFSLQWGVQLPLAWLIGVRLGCGLMGIAIIRLLLFAVEAAVVTLMWRDGFWHGGARPAGVTRASSRRCPALPAGGATGSGDSGRRR